MYVEYRNQDIVDRQGLSHERITSYREMVQRENGGMLGARLRRGWRRRIPQRSLKMRSQRQEKEILEEGRTISLSLPKGALVRTTWHNN